MFKYAYLMALESHPYICSTYMYIYEYIYELKDMCSIAFSWQHSM